MRVTLVLKGAVPNAAKLLCTTSALSILYREVRP